MSYDRKWREKAVANVPFTYAVWEEWVIGEMATPRAQRSKREGWPILKVVAPAGAPTLSRKQRLAGETCAKRVYEVTWSVRHQRWKHQRKKNGVFLLKDERPKLYAAITFWARQHYARIRDRYLVVT